MGTVEKKETSLRTPRSAVTLLRTKGFRIRGEDIVLFVYVRNDGSDESRLGVSSRKMKGAVHRNRIRRRLRNAARYARPFPQGCDLFLIGASTVEELPWQQLVEEIQGLMHRAYKRFSIIVDGRKP